eukprot:CAMPEP_0183342140 /NCGR_PEP_ID=MMETSP0164_2-20130417/8301_1 /TAXON_ID=221442 /ORGANISM="Coccolithus pelagicus ssp braarudi, Strain PLY182g" /LENGTH=82 /DNA_ID=CAMNT_0025512639 /DNA_START=846 /DNA_END=1094 /DNA_ORIENTATION=+
MVDLASVPAAGCSSAPTLLRAEITSTVDAAQPSTCTISFESAGSDESGRSVTVCSSSLSGCRKRASIAVRRATAPCYRFHGC